MLIEWLALLKRRLRGYRPLTCKQQSTSLNTLQTRIINIYNYEVRYERTIDVKNMFISEQLLILPVGIHPVGIHPVGIHPVGIHPVGIHPVGIHPVGIHPVGIHPVGIHPVGIHPVGIHPVGIHPVGIHPVGIHPVGIHPVDMRKCGFVQRVFVRLA